MGTVNEKVCESEMLVKNNNNTCGKLLQIIIIHCGIFLQIFLESAHTVSDITHVRVKQCSTR